MIKKFLHCTLLVLSLLSLTSCAIFPSRKINPETGYFPANKNRKVIVHTALPVSADTLKKLLVVMPLFDQWTKTAENINYFDEVIYYGDFIKEIDEKGLGQSFTNENNEIDLGKVYKEYRPFTVLYYEQNKFKNGKTYGAVMLYRPDTDKVIFSSYARINRLTDGTSYSVIYYPLFNSLLDYLRAQK